MNTFNKLIQLLNLKNEIYSQTRILVSIFKYLYNNFHLANRPRPVIIELYRTGVSNLSRQRVTTVTSSRAGCIKITINGTHNRLNDCVILCSIYVIYKVPRTAQHNMASRRRPKERGMVAHDIQPTEGERVPVRHIAIFTRNTSCQGFRILYYTYMTQYIMETIKKTLQI